MTAADRAALRALAEKATPGPWRARSTIYEHMIAGIAARGAIAEIWKGERGMEDARYIAAAHPQAVLALLDEVERLREALKDARDAVSAWAAYASPYFQEKHDLQGDIDAIDAALAEPSA